MVELGGDIDDRATPRQTGMAFQAGYMRALFKAASALDE